MAPPQNRTGVFLDARVLLVGGGLALIGVLVLVFFMWMVPNAAEREAKHACAGLVSQPPLNPALCPAGVQCTYPIKAPDFTALDHNGKPVHLSDFRGKVVLVNFWASWCGVCETEKPHLKEMAAELGGSDFVVIALASDKNWTDVLIAIITALAPDSGLAQVRAMNLKATPPDDVAKVIKTHPKEAERIFQLAMQVDAGYVQAIEASLKQHPAITLADALDAYKHALPGGVPFDVLLDKPNGDDTIGAIAASWGIKAVPESALIDKDGNLRHYFVNKRDWQMPVAETCLRSVIDE
jgi:thiol-disulfide isomerase/thioredoxin